MLPYHAYLPTRTRMRKDSSLLSKFLLPLGLVLNTFYILASRIEYFKSKYFTLLYLTLQRSQSVKSRSTTTTTLSYHQLDLFEIMSRSQGPTLINLPPPPSEGGTPSDFGPYVYFFSNQ